MKEAKRRAANEGKALTRVMEDALRSYLRPTGRATKKLKVELRVKSGPPIHGVDFADRDSLYAWLEGDK